MTADASCHEWGICNVFCIGGIIQAERSLHRREIYDGFHFLALSYILDKKKKKKMKKDKLLKRSKFVNYGLFKINSMVFIQHSSSTFQ